MTKTVAWHPSSQPYPRSPPEGLLRSARSAGWRRRRAPSAPDARRRACVWPGWRILCGLDVHKPVDGLCTTTPVAIHQARRRDVKSAGVLSGGFEAGRKPGVAAEEVAEGVEFADAPFRGG